MRLFHALIEKNNDFASRNPVTLVALGDSVTHGCFETFRTHDGGLECRYDYESVYHARLRKKCATILPAAPLNVINAGISGDSAPGGLARLQRDVLHFAPDLVTVCFGLNDVNGGMEKIEQYTTALTGIFQALHDHHIDTIFITPNMMNSYVSPALTDPGLAEFAAHTAALQQTGVMDAYMEAARTVCTQMDVPLCDVYRQWRHLADAGVDTTALLANHINHPTREMHALFADALFAMLAF
ncbi:MAG TPA: SGNH/GDSL hydrolase family protein [Armatimonadota bacterium]|nr:SGNH/GDSL hydrolase family protein [Armatimonadota bacterium]